MTRPDPAKIAEPVTCDPETRFHLWLVVVVVVVVVVVCLHSLFTNQIIVTFN